jgi:hypothetical protein
MICVDVVRTGFLIGLLMAGIGRTQWTTRKSMSPGPMGMRDPVRGVIAATARQARFFLYSFR